MEKLPKSAGLPRLPMLTTPTDPGNTNEILFGKNRVVKGQERRALPLNQGVGQERLRAMDTAVQAEPYGGGAGIVGVLYELLEDRGPLRVVQQHLPDPPGEVNLLTEVFQKDRLRRRRRIHLCILLRRIRDLSCSGRCPRLDHRNEAKTTGEPDENCVNRVLPWSVVWREGTDEGTASFFGFG